MLNMCPKICLLTIAMLVTEIKGVIYFLNDTEYNRMPPVYKLDDYKTCLEKPTDVYCNVDFNLISDTENERLTMIHEYSEHTCTHYNHSQLNHGICYTQRCQNYIDHTKMKTSIEKCLNDTFMKEYGLSTQVTRFNCHGLSDTKRELDKSDIAVAILLLTIVLLNVAGTIYDYNRKENIKEKKYLLCFSIARNWKKLTSYNSNAESQIEYLKGLNGIRCIILVGVIMVHNTWPYMRAGENLHVLELSFYKVRQNILMTGSLGIQINFLISGFLLAHNTEMYMENNSINWYSIPKSIISRFFRITPVYAVVIAVSATWIKYLGPGPLWQDTGNVLYSHCRSGWWRNLLYINNYKYNSQCLPHSWYLGADMQLYCLGIILCVILKKKSLRKPVLAGVLLLGIAAIAIHTYVRDLDPILILSPGEVKTLFWTAPTFNETYKMGHANIPSFIIGMMLGYYVYEKRKTGLQVPKSRGLRYIYWALVPLAMAVMFSGELFYRDAPRDPLSVRVAYAALIKPIFSSLIAMLLLGMIFKIENVFRRVLEWDMWIIPSRLSYSVYINHMVLIRLYIGLSHSLFFVSHTNMNLLTVGVTLVSLIVAVPLCLLIEIPFLQVFKCYMIGNNKKKEIEKSL
ncbi:O-acyltransferase like protein-like [Danaus plexippus]|uniref:O-acyltransferase like protein-like n=1 Tax=Danaus plexippus TaxID=13037 RepID=UPI002AB1085C|nr:O-acyltransferase like protein-like [Danaus plexippus]